MKAQQKSDERMLELEEKRLRMEERQLEREAQQRREDRVSVANGEIDDGSRHA